MPTVVDPRSEVFRQTEAELIQLLGGARWTIRSRTFKFWRGEFSHLMCPIGLKVRLLAYASCPPRQSGFPVGLVKIERSFVQICGRLPRCGRMKRWSDCRLFSEPAERCRSWKLTHTHIYIIYIYLRAYMNTYIHAYLCTYKNTILHHLHIQIQIHLTCTIHLHREACTYIVTCIDMYADMRTHTRMHKYIHT